MFKKYIRWRLERYVKKYFKVHHPTLIAVVGSVGKTTTKTAIATVLSNRFRVQMEPGNLNSEMSVPLAILGIKYPPLALLRKYSTWHRIFKAMKVRIKSEQGVDVIIQELATDKPGDIDAFGKYLSPDIAVVTAVAPEHMENFPNGLSDVAREELAIAKYSKLTIVNHDDVDVAYAAYAETSNITTYGIEGGEYRIDIMDGNPLTGYNVRLFAPEFGGASAENPNMESDASAIPATIHYLGEHNVRSAVAAAAVAAKLGMTPQDITSGLAQLHPVAGRMNPLPGMEDSVIIDDTYNSSPEAAVAALNTLYQIDAPQRIAILGSMNELGQYSAQAHQQVGAACDPMMLYFVITIGDEAARYLAPAAMKRGCQVASFPGPIMAATFAKQQLKPHAAILVKGSQNGVYAEEATKNLLRNIDDRDKLVRQSDEWMEKKNKWFEEIRHIQQNDEE